MWIKTYQHDYSQEKNDELCLYTKWSNNYTHNVSQRKRIIHLWKTYKIACIVKVNCFFMLYNTQNYPHVIH